MTEPRKARPIIDLFSGFGGFTVGLMEANFYPLRAFEIDLELSSLYNTNINHVCAPYGVHKVKWPLILQHHRRIPTMISLIVGDAPFGENTYQHAFHFFRAVREVCPLGFAFLTDPLFLTQDNPMVWAWRVKQRRILSDYRWGYQIIDYANMGVPLKKQRALVFGVHQQCRVEGFDNPLVPLYMDFPKIDLPSSDYVFDLLPTPRPFNIRSQKVTGHSSRWEKIHHKPSWPFDHRKGPLNAHHPWQERRLTQREILRVLGFPDTMFLFEDTDRKKLWEATPVPVAAMIGAWFMRVDRIYRWSEKRLSMFPIKVSSTTYATKRRQRLRASLNRIKIMAAQRRR